MRGFELNIGKIVYSIYLQQLLYLQKIFTRITFPKFCINKNLSVQKQTLKAEYLQTIDWFNDDIVDWNSAGTCYSIDGTKKQIQKYHFGFNCDASITSQCGTYAFIYKKLGTKGLLLKNGEILREINRSYYQSDCYEYPAAFITYLEKTYLVHCPNSYCQLDFEDVETGEIMTDKVERNPQDIFHSRLEVSPDNRFVLSKGWIWHPIDVIELYEIEKCFSDPTVLDSESSISNLSVEICSANFIDQDKILLCTSAEEPLDEENNRMSPNHLAIWNFKTDEIEKTVKPDFGTRNVFAINEDLCWDLYQYPKIIDLNNGKIVAEFSEINSGVQCSSIISGVKNLPQIAFHRSSKQIAIAMENSIEVLSV